METFMSSFETISWDETSRVMEENAPLDQAWTLFPPFLMRLTELDSSASSVRSISRRMHVAAWMYFDYVLTHHESHMKADLLSGVLLARREKRIHAFFRLHEGDVLLLTYEPKSLQAGYRVLPFSCGRPGFLKKIKPAAAPFLPRHYCLDGIEAFMLFDQLLEQVDELIRVWTS